MRGGAASSGSGQVADRLSPRRSAPRSRGLPAGSRSRCADDDRRRDVAPCGRICSQNGSRHSSTMDDAVLGVVDDVGELVGVQAQVEGVEDAARERDAEVGLEVRSVVPAQRGDAVAGLNAEVDEHLGQAAGAAGEVGVGVAADQAAVGKARDDFAGAEELFGAAENRRQRQREVHHQAVHGADCMPTGSAASMSREPTTRRVTGSRERQTPESVSCKTGLKRAARSGIECALSTSC